MTTYTRRDLLGGIAGATGVLAGCSENEAATSGAFTGTRVEDQQLIVEFEESLEAESISVIDPNGKAFAETSVAAGASRVTFDIGMPYTPGEYHIVAADDGGTVAETTQEIQPELEIVDVGIGANRMDEMPGGLHYPERQVLVAVRNQGIGPAGVTRLEFSEDFPNSNSDRGGSGIFSDESGETEVEQKIVPAGDQEHLFSSTLPFADYESNCSTNPVITTAKIRLERRLSEVGLEKSVEIYYTEGASEDSCQVEILGVEDA